MKYGVKSVTMDDISKKLGISKKTLYTVIKDKNELIEKTSFSISDKVLSNINELLKKKLAQKQFLTIRVKRKRLKK